ncbi:glycerophosphoryl diester phosphodiesterase [Parelusimicrobium proximum]|uniref:glycerophosphodiester phosphodiesterase n=1 Tax=Parelusimicrobium proximum TaxID=3228953 RepID=UPI003D16493A
MIFIAHRGAPALSPENTLSSFQVALNKGMEYYELDVHLTKDNVLVVCHDESLYTADKKIVFIKDLNYEELLKVNTADSSIIKAKDIPALDTVLKLLKNKKVNIELKTDEYAYPGIEDAVLKMVNDLSLKENILISSFNFSTLERVRGLDKDIKIGVLAKEIDLEKFKTISPVSVNISKSRIDREKVSAVHDAGLKVFVYTVNDKETYLKIKELGADGVFTDSPALKDEVK